MPYFQNYIPTDISCYRSQRMASIALSVVGCIDYLAYGAILRVRCFHSWRREGKLEFFDVGRWCGREGQTAYYVERKALRCGARKTTLINK